MSNIKFFRIGKCNKQLYMIIIVKLSIINQKKYFNTKMSQI